MRKIAVIAIAVLLTGCITIGSDPISIGPDTYQMSMTGSVFATQGNTTMTALKAASDFCARHNLNMMLQHSDESGVYGFSPRRSSLVFLCLKDTDPRYIRAPLAPVENH